MATQLPPVEKSPLERISVRFDFRDLLAEAQDQVASWDVGADVGVDLSGPVQAEGVIDLFVAGGANKRSYIVAADIETLGGRKWRQELRVRVRGRATDGDSASGSVVTVVDGVLYLDNQRIIFDNFYLAYSMGEIKLQPQGGGTPVAATDQQLEAIREELGISAAIQSAIDEALGSTPSPSPSPAPSPTPAPSPSGADTRPGWFAAPGNAATDGTAGLIAGRAVLSGGSNGGSTGSASVTATGSDYVWFAVASATVPTFTDSGGFAGGFTASGTFSDSSTTWRLYRSDYPAAQAGELITLS